MITDPFNDRLANVLDYVAHYFPDHVYEVKFRRLGKGWQFIIQGDPSIASNSKSPTIFCQVEGGDFNALPEMLFVKIKDRVAKYIEAATSAIDDKRSELEKAREELDRRLRADIDYIRVGKSLGIKPEDETTQPVPSPNPEPA